MDKDALMGKNQIDFLCLTSNELDVPWNVWVLINSSAE